MWNRVTGDIFSLAYFRFRKAYPQNSHIFTRPPNIRITPFHTENNFKSNSKHKKPSHTKNMHKEPSHINHLYKKPSHTNNLYQKLSHKQSSYTSNLHKKPSHTSNLHKKLSHANNSHKNHHVLTILIKTNTQPLLLPLPPQQTL